MNLLTTAPKYLSDATVSVTILNYLLGLRIFKYPRGKAGVVLSLIYLLFILGIFGVGVNQEYKFYKKIKLMKLEYILYEVMVYVNAFVISYEVILSWFYTKNINACYEKIAQIDDTLRQLGSMFNYRKIYFLSVSFIIICVLTFVFSIILQNMYLFASPCATTWMIVTEMYSIAINFIVMLEFAIFVMCLKMKFKLVNELLSEGAAVSTVEGVKLGFFTMKDYVKTMETKKRKRILSIKTFSQINRQVQSRLRSTFPRKRNVRSWTRSHLPSQLQKQFHMELQGQCGNQVGNTNSTLRSVVITGYQKRKHLLQTIRQVHLELCRISKTLCTSFGVQITSEIGVSIMTITGVLYNLYVRLVEQRTPFNYSIMNYTSVAVAMGLIYTLKIVLINSVCKNATYEGKKTTEIIHAIYKYYEDADIREEIQQFGLQMSQSAVDIGGFGITLNYEIVGACLKTVTTYLVIMIQMGNSLESSKYSRDKK